MAGIVGMTEREFWTSSLRFIYNRLEGYRKSKEMDLQVQYEVARYNAMLVLSPNVKKGKSLKATDLSKFRWEMTERERAELEKEAEKADPVALAAMQDKVHKAIEEGRIKWEPVTNINDIK